MKIIVVGGTGQLGSRIVAKLNQDGHEALAASPETGVNTITGEGLDQALAGADVVVDASNAPAWDDAAVMEFFQTASRNLTKAAAGAGARHYVVMSIVGADRLPASGYLRAKVAQEEVVKAATIPFTIVRATQFYEFVGRIADAATTDSTVTLPDAQFQPASADDLAAGVAHIAEGKPVNGIVELAGPQALPMGEAVKRLFETQGDSRKVVADPGAQYFGAELSMDSLLPGEAAHLTSTGFTDWLGQQ